MELPSQGESFQRKYKLHEILGKGGFAAVYRATDLEIGRDVAIKILAPSDDGYSQGIESRFMREARVIASLQDPHTITMFEFGHSEEGLLYMVFEYVRGTDLSVLVKRSPLSEAATIHIMEQVLQSLREAHAAGVLHRDIKPANILVYEYMDDPHRAKLLDFGIAKAVTGGDGVDLTTAGAMIGTPRYMSPEQIYGGELAATSDIYSLGLVAFEMLMGQPAITGRTTKEMMVQQLSDDPVQLPPGSHVSPGLRNVINRMTARETEARFATADQVLHALDMVKFPQGRHTGGWAAAGGPRASGALRPPTGGFSLQQGPQGPQAPQGPQGPAGPGFAGPGQAHGHTQQNWTGNRPATGGYPVSPSTQIEPPPAAVPTWVLGLGGLAVGAAVVAGGMYVSSHNSGGDPPVVAPKKRDVTKLFVEPPRPDTGIVQRPKIAAVASADVGLDVATGPDANASASGCGRTPDWTKSREFSLSTYTGRRDWIVYLPKGYDPDKKHSVVMLFHKGFNDGTWLLKDSGVKPIADREQFVVLSLDAQNSTSAWDGEDDTFVRAALDATAEKVCLDRRRVFAVGHGGGGDFIRELSCMMPLAGIASVGSGESRGGKVCLAEPPVPYLRTAGLQDNYLPPEGGAGCLGGNYRSLKELDDSWKSANICTGPARVWMKKGNDVCETWACESPFVSCKLEGGHDWPDSTPEKFEMPGCAHPAPKFPIMEAMWKFFEEQVSVDNSPKKAGE